jgi:mersacidin/lichenicidin family type 2 lantibiotic
MKKNIDVARVWRDEDYFLSLTEEERANLGKHPCGVVALQDEILASITGGCCSTEVCGTYYCSPCPRWDWCN